MNIWTISYIYTSHFISALNRLYLCPSIIHDFGLNSTSYIMQFKLVLIYYVRHIIFQTVLFVRRAVYSTPVVQTNLTKIYGSAGVLVLVSCDVLIPSLPGLRYVRAWYSTGSLIPIPSGKAWLALPLRPRRRRCLAAQNMAWATVHLYPPLALVTHQIFKY